MKTSNYVNAMNIDKNKKEYLSNSFKGVDSPEQVFTEIEFDGCTFIECNFTECIFDHCKFIDCSFENCNLSIVQFKNQITRNLIMHRSLTFFKGSVTIGEDTNHLCESCRNWIKIVLI